MQMQGLRNDYEIRSVVREAPGENPFSCQLSNLEYAMMHEGVDRGFSIR